jgi:hypothetical protein
MMDTFSPDNEPQKTMLLHEPNGVLQVTAYFHHVDERNNIDFNRYILLDGNGQGQTQALITLTPTTHSVPIAPGENRCTQVDTQSASGEERTITPEERPELADLSFRYEYSSGEHEKTGGPQLLGFVNQALVTLTAPERTTDELRRFYSVLTDALAESYIGVEQAQETVRVEIPELAAFTEELARKRNTDAWIAFIKMLVAILGWLLIRQSVGIQDVDIAPHVQITMEQDESTQ